MDRLSSRIHLVLFLTLTVLIGSSGVWAQTAQITGRVTDATGAVVPGTAITVRNVATGIDRKVTTNEAGFYAVSLLLPGEYRVTVEQRSFKPIVRSGIVLEVDQRAELNFTLEVGALAEAIEVRAAAPQLNTVEASRGQVIENKRIVELPLNGRTYDELALLSAGTVQPLGGSRFAGFNSGGVRNTQNNFLLDGLDNNPTELAGAQRRSEMVQPSIDAIQEFKVQTNSYAAEYGRAMGSVVNVTTKSGTNALHGSVFEFLRNEKVDAHNFFDPVNAKKPPFKRNQYGFAAGGPVYIPKLINGLNKAFFFGDFEGTRIRQTDTGTRTLPTLKMRTGDFSELMDQRNLKILDPLNSNTQFPGNIIPQARQDAVSRTLINLYPTPQNSNVGQNFVYLGPTPEDWDRFDVRGDVNVGTRDNFSWRFSRHDKKTPAPLALPPPAYGGGAYDQWVRGNNTGGTWNHIFGPTLIMSIRGGWNYGYFTRDNPAQTNGELLNRKYGIKGGNDTIPGGFSQMGITGYQALGIGANNPVKRDSQNRQLAGDLTWTHGSHNVKFGGNLLRSQNNIFNIRNEVLGPIQFTGKYTKDGMADFLIGWPNQVTWMSRLQVNLRMWNIAGYAQDDWKVTPKLTLNLGLRYEIVLPWIEKRNKMGDFDTWTDPAHPVLIHAGGSDRYGRAMVATDKNNFMPRFGLAYKLGSKTVLRTGYGVFFAFMEPYGDAEWLIGNPPDAFGVTISSTATSPAIHLADGPAPDALILEKATGVTLSSIERQAITSYGQQWNFNIQRELGSNWMIEVGYSGSKGTHVESEYDANYALPGGEGTMDSRRTFHTAVVPGTSTVLNIGPSHGYHFNGNSIYHALVSKLEKRFSNGFTLLTSYGFSKTISDVCGNSAAGAGSNCGIQDMRNLRAERGLDNNDIPHRFVLSGVYELPLGKGRHFASRMPAVADAVLGGWSLGSIVTRASSRPYSVADASNPANAGSLGYVARPNLVGDPYAITRTLDRDFDTSVFVQVPKYLYGNSGRNILRPRATFNWDFSAHKEFRLQERLRLQFRFEAFTFTNTPRFGDAGAGLNTAAFGKITSAADPRNLQFGMKLVW